MGNKNVFSFELAWFEREGFIDLIARECAKATGGNSNIERWQNKIRHLRPFCEVGPGTREGFTNKKESDLLN